MNRLLTRLPAALAAAALFAAAAPVGADAHAARPSSAHRPAHGAPHGARRHRLARRRHRLARHRACPHTRLRPTHRDLKLIRMAVLCLINHQRIAHGERRLRPNARLRRAAQRHSASMARDDYFEHVGPGGQTPLARMRSVGYVSSARVGYEVGENIAWGTLWLATPRAIVSAWMRSPAHRANILDPRYRDTGIGVSPWLPSSFGHGQRGAIYTQDFGVIIKG